MHYLFTWCVLAILLILTTVDNFQMCTIDLPGANQKCQKDCNLKGCEDGYCSTDICKCTGCDEMVNTADATYFCELITKRI